MTKQELKETMPSIIVLLDLDENEIVGRFEGRGDSVADHVLYEVQRRTDETGHTHALARLTLTFQPE